MRMLDSPCLERYPRVSESWTVRLAMLAPNILPRLVPLFRKKGVGLGVIDVQATT